MKPYLKAQTIPLAGLQDRRRKLTEEQKTRIREIYAEGNLGCRSIAKMYGVSKSLVQMIVNPERAQRARERFAAHWREYHEKYGKAAHAAAIRNTRNYKYEVFKSLADRKDHTFLRCEDCSKNCKCQKQKKIPSYCLKGCIVEVPSGKEES